MRLTKKKGIVSSKMVGIMLLLIVLMVFTPLVSKAGKGGNSLILSGTCKLEDYDGDGISNGVEQSGVGIDKPCPCDDKNDAEGWGYKLRSSTFNYSTYKDDGPYALFDKNKEEIFLSNLWISDYDFKELRWKLYALRIGSGATKYDTPMFFSDDLTKRLISKADLSHPPSYFFCPRSCKGKSKNDFTCCDLETFKKEWFQQGTNEGGLKGACKTDGKECNLLMMNKCEEDSKKK